MIENHLCAYCGEIATDREHVFPRCLYPSSKNKSSIQRLTVPACNKCNNGWSNNEAHFRNVLILAGKPNNVVYELWEKMQRSFTKTDGKTRLKDIITQMKPTAENNYMIYPGQEERVIKIVKKIIRGLSHYHNISTAVSENRIWTDILKYHIPPKFLNEMNYSHREQDIVEYRFQIINEYDIQSAWIITFFERVTFIGTVSSQEIK